MKKQIVYLILSLSSVVLAYGKPIEIKGYLAVVLWVVPFALMVLCIKNNKEAFRLLFVTSLISYMIASGLNYIRGSGGIRLKHAEYNGRDYTEVCEIDPGAMGSVSVRKREYFIVIESNVLTIRVLKRTDIYKGWYDDLEH